jgi:hypothetical protein
MGMSNIEFLIGAVRIFFVPQSYCVCVRVCLYIIHVGMQLSLFIELKNIHFVYKQKILASRLERIALGIRASLF